MRIAIVALHPSLLRYCVTDYNLALAHLWKDPTYLEFWKVNKRNKYLILDNGAAEGTAMSGLRLMELIERSPVKIDEVVAPDVIGDAYATTRMTETFTRRYGDQLRTLGVRIMGVPQGKTIDEWLDCYSEMKNNPYIRTIGLNKAMDNLGYGPRAFWLSVLRAEMSGKQAHLLGCSTWVGEPYWVSRNPLFHGWIRGMDTSYPVIAGLSGVSLSSVWDRREQLIGQEFVYAEEAHERIIENIIQLLHWGGQHVYDGTS